MKENPCTASRDIIRKQSGMAGLLGNLILVIIKGIAGILSGSVAITADALNNLIPPKDETDHISRNISCIRTEIKQELQIDATIYWALPEAVS